MSAQDYFNDMMRRQRRLEEHGFATQPDIIELTEAYIDLFDQVEALYAACSCIAVQDFRGWHAYRPNRTVR